MRKRFVVFLIVGLMAGTPCYAETIYFKDGNKIKAEVIEKGGYYIVVRQDGRPRRYYMDLIDRIEEDIVDAEISENINMDLDQFMFTPETKIEWILKLMEVNGTRAVLKQNIERIIEQAPEDQKAQVKAIFDFDGLMEQIIPVFDEHYTEQEIKELVTFYESPLGQKVLKETPLIMDEVMQSTLKYFSEKANR